MIVWRFRARPDRRAIDQRIERIRPPRRPFLSRSTQRYGRSPLVRQIWIPSITFVSRMSDSVRSTTTEGSLGDRRKIAVTLSSDVAKISYHLPQDNPLQLPPAAAEAPLDPCCVRRPCPVTTSRD